MTTKTKTIDEVRKLVRERVTQLSRKAIPVGETYLFRGQRLRGIRFAQGVFTAQWELDETEVRVMRDDQQILVIDVSVATVPARRAA